MKKLTRSAGETRKIAAQIARKIVSRGPGKTAIVLALQGELGSGKTTFVQGFCEGLGLKKRAVSPTFVILRRTVLNKDGFKNLFHMDAYRLKSGKETGPLELKKLFKKPENILLIEWAENIKSILPKSSIRIRFLHVKKEKERTLLF